MYSYDVVIVGGAAMGSSVACHLLEDPTFSGSVLVVEKDPTYARSASALSAASIRQQFGSAINVRISMHGIAFLREIGARLAVDGDRPEIGLTEGGYLYVADEESAGVLRSSNLIQRSEGADVALFDVGALADRFPWINVTDLALGSFGVSGEGWFDGWGLLQAFRRKARALGARYMTAEVAGLERTGPRIDGVVLADGTRIGAGHVVNCAGAGGGRRIASIAGVDVPVYAKKRCVFSFSCRTPTPGFPLLIDTSGVWCRPEGEGFICGFSPDDLDRTDHGEDFEVDWSIFEDIVWPALAHRVPSFEAIRLGRAWAGHYDMNLLDANAIVGKAEGCDNFYLAIGFSGHGLQQSPAVGRGLAELITHGRFLTLDLSDLGHRRIIENRPLRERNVI
jgi:glycine/D-amino acid oxidase-like deaminating enzyme